MVQINVNEIELRGMSRDTYLDTIVQSDRAAERHFDYAMFCFSFSIGRRDMLHCRRSLRAEVRRGRNI